MAALEYGVAKSRSREKNRQALIDFATPFDVIEFNDSDSEVFGLIRAGLQKRGWAIGPYDMQIAARAMRRNLVLVTNNTAEFSRIPDLKLENWI